MVASEAGETTAYIALIKRLLKYKVGLNDLNRWGKTLLTEVIKHGNDQSQVELSELLLKAGTSPNRLNGKQQVPLGVINQIPKIEHRKKIVKLLIDYGANPLLAQMDKETQAYVREILIDQLEKINLDLSDPTLSKALTEMDARLRLFFNQKYKQPDIGSSGEEKLTCVVCSKKEIRPTTIQIPSCGHYVHGSCLAQALIKSKGAIKWFPRPSYLYTHLCPCCKKDIAHAFIKDLNIFYEGIKFQHMGITLALRIAFAIPCATVIPGGFVLLAGLFLPMPDRIV